ncbi:sigma factor, partial [Rhizobium leguminosarum]|uniref:sigma factor n=1 Tax=Rhizobium leguminosarum TaxID=384 RepID=UPI003F966DD5
RQAVAAITHRDLRYEAKMSGDELVGGVPVTVLGITLGEVVSEGNVGLMQAVKKFDAERGFRLATYAMWWIKASIQEYILRS